MTNKKKYCVREMGKRIQLFTGYSHYCNLDDGYIVQIRKKKDNPRFFEGRIVTPYGIVQINNPNVHDSMQEVVRAAVIQIIASD